MIAVRNPFDHVVFPISHMLETVATSMDKVSRLGRWLLIDIVSLNMLSSRMSHFFPHSLGKSWALIFFIGFHFPASRCASSI